MGWSEIPKYTFKVPQGWQETPVSIADLGGTEVQLIILSCTYTVSFLQQSSLQRKRCLGTITCMPKQRSRCTSFVMSPSIVAMHDTGCLHEWIAQVCDLHACSLKGTRVAPCRQLSCADWPVLHETQIRAS